MLKIIPRQSFPDSVSDFIREHYEEVFGWCLQITGNNAWEAEDLIQDAYLLFRNSSISTAELRNIEGYIYVVLRNLNRSRYERKRRHVPIPILDYDCARIGLATTDSSHLLEVADQLRHICRFACERKEKSRAGSVLILRFFHGYYPTEIGAILLTSRDAVDEHLRTIRRAACDSLVGSEKPIRAGSVQTGNGERIVGLPTAETLLEELHRSIFSSCSSSCPSSDSLARHYRRESMSPLPTQLLAHVVSCKKCLEIVNSLLDLSSLNRRDPNDTAGKHSSKSPTFLSLPHRRNKSTKNNSRVALLERLTSDVYEHQPESLCVAVNGQPVVFQHITGSDFEITVKLHQFTGIDFIEVFSEQDIRLIMIPILELPPNGPYEQFAVSRFSDNRELRATFSYTSPWPSVHVSYRKDIAIPVVFPSFTERAETSVLNRLEQAIPTGSRWNWPIWKWAGATLSFLAIFLYIVEQSRLNTVEAKTLLHESMMWEKSVRAAGPNVVRQRFQFKEMNSTPTKRKVIEVWRGLGRQDRYLRLLDESGKLVATSNERPPDDHARQLETLWQFEPSAETFVVFTRPDEQLKATQHTDVNEIKARDITLVLQRKSGRPVREVLRVDGRQFEFSETTFDIVPAAGSPIPAPAPTPSREHPIPLSAVLPPRRDDYPTLEQLQLAELQARVALHKVGADLKENPQINQFHDGIAVMLVVDTRERRNQLQRTLAQIPLIKARFRVVEDVSGRVSTLSVKTQGEQTLADQPQARYKPLMQEYLQKQLGSTSAANQVAEAAANAADELMRRSVTISQLADRYGTAELAALSPNARREFMQLMESNLNQLEIAHKNFKGIVLDLVHPVTQLTSTKTHSVARAEVSDWPEAAADLIDTARQIHATCGTLFVETTRRPEDSLPNLADLLMLLGSRFHAVMQDLRTNPDQYAAH